MDLRAMQGEVTGSAQGVACEAESTLRRAGVARGGLWLVEQAGQTHEILAILPSGESGFGQHRRRSVGAGGVSGRCAEM